MSVEQVIIETTGDGVTRVMTRVLLACEVLATVDARRTRVRILEAGAGLAVHDEIVVPTAKLTES